MSHRIEPRATGWIGLAALLLGHAGCSSNDDAPGTTVAASCSADTCDEGSLCLGSGATARCTPIACAALEDCCSLLENDLEADCQATADGGDIAGCADALNAHREQGYCHTQPASEDGYAPMCNVTGACEAEILRASGRGESVCCASEGFTCQADACAQCLPQGSPCDYEASWQCCPGLDCAIGSRQCVPLLAQGELCLSDRECELGLRCKENNCEVVSGLDGPCQSTEDCDGIYLSCNAGRCTYAGGSGAGGTSGGGSAGGSATAACDASSCSGLDCAGGFCCNSFCENDACQTVCN